MIPEPFPSPLPPNGAPLAGFGEIFRQVLGDGWNDAFPFSAGTGLEALFDRMEAGQ